MAEIDVMVAPAVVREPDELGGSKIDFFIKVRITSARLMLKVGLKNIEKMRSKRSCALRLKLVSLDAENLFKFVASNLSATLGCIGIWVDENPFEWADRSVPIRRYPGGSAK